MLVSLHRHGVDGGSSGNTEIITDNTAQIAENIADIASNTTAIEANTTATNANTTAIGDNATNIATNATAIATNKTSIEANTAKVNSLEADIATNAANITTNTNGIATNTTAILENTTNITTIVADVEAMKATIEELRQQIQISIGGVDDKWADETANRNFGDTYTNTTGKPIQLSVTCEADGNGKYFSLTIDGVITKSHNMSSYEKGHSHRFNEIVPIGSTYMIDYSGRKVDSYTWLELK